ncbi:hypothetical protein AK812_SmicGene14914 [Symbiodinium microadriaticum]|uniref:Protein NLRC3 n=1 Tax=Symbiodinium microadriaticum TaxID=2951 RepID=A0A1Q9E4A4_SYMMI|nr:hypothetical protein AK812_SmicGene14914 [Symbiodinium microadriaticum]
MVSIVVPFWGYFLGVEVQSTCSLMKTDSAGIHLANSLLENEGLEVLSMRDNSIRDASASAFAEALHHNGTVTQLNLELNRLMQMPNEFWRSCVRVLYADQELPAADDIVEVYMMPVNRNMGTSGVMSQDDCVFQILSGSREKAAYMGFRFYRAADFKSGLLRLRPAADPYRFQEGQPAGFQDTREKAA